MTFPESKRVLYKRSPLREVICQFRFPPILSIDVDIPAKFQESIRQEYPYFNEKEEFQIKIPEELSSQIPSELIDLPSTNITKKNYEFISEDDNWRVNLTRTFLALTTRKYTRWEEFKVKLSKPLNALIDIYSLEFFTRIGLRYKDIIRRSALGLDNVPWEDLLNPYILGILSAPDINEKLVKSSQNTTEIILDDNKGLVRIVSGLVKAADTGEISYAVDSDFFIEEKTNPELAIDQLDYFNQLGSRLIQWSITDQLHDALEPQEL